jgi:hypothetical protein
MGIKLMFGTVDEVVLGGNLNSAGHDIRPAHSRVDFIMVGKKLEITRLIALRFLAIEYHFAGRHATLSLL